MIRARICFAAFAVIRDTETNSISAFNIVEGIAAAGFPFFMPSLTFFVLWQREPNDPARINGRFTVSIEEQELVALPIEADFGQGLRNRNIVNLGGLVVPRVGALRMTCVLDTGARADYAVDITPPPAIVQAQAQH